MLDIFFCIERKLDHYNVRIVISVFKQLIPLYTKSVWYVQLFSITIKLK
ncbi:hypothetical protein HMPREF0995_04790 [Lachnospiraceae bacterium 7_1_58FAA]|nr:hypothetical protein HMPREF0995_04790 [Lachnospiraceae bacterium 7_1_58FAA]